MSRKIVTICIALLIFYQSISNVYAMPPAYVKEVNISGDSEIVMVIGETITLAAEADPQGVNRACIAWGMDNGGVVNLQAGDSTISLTPPISYAEITALDAGVVIISAYASMYTSVNDKIHEASDSVKITVIDPHADVVCNEAFEQNNVSLVTMSLGLGNGDKIIMVDDKELYYNSQRYIYIGLVDSLNVSEDKTLTSVTIINGSPATFTFGNLDDDDVVDAADLQIMKLAIKGSKTLEGKYLIASDVDGDGLCDAADLQAMKLKIKNNKEFPVLK